MEANAIFNINVPKEYRAVCQDITRMLTIQIITNFLLYLSNPNQTVFLSQDFIKTLLYLLIGIITYWLITNKVFSFTDVNETKNGFFYGNNG